MIMQKDSNSSMIVKNLQEFLNIFKTRIKHFFRKVTKIKNFSKGVHICYFFALHFRE